MAPAAHRPRRHRLGHPLHFPLRPIKCKPEPPLHPAPLPSPPPSPRHGPRHTGARPPPERRRSPPPAPLPPLQAPGNLPLAPLFLLVAFPCDMVPGRPFWPSPASPPPPPPLGAAAADCPPPRAATGRCRPSDEDQRPRLKGSYTPWVRSTVDHGPGPPGRSTRPRQHCVTTCVSTASSKPPRVAPMAHPPAALAVLQKEPRDFRIHKYILPPL
jgi:hypothetical protein